MIEAHHQAIGLKPLASSIYYRQNDQFILESFFILQNHEAN